MTRCKHQMKTSTDPEPRYGILNPTAVRAAASAGKPGVKVVSWLSYHPHIRYFWEPSDTLQAFLAKEIQERLKMSCKTTATAFYSQKLGFDFHASYIQNSILLFDQPHQRDQDNPSEAFAGGWRETAAGDGSGHHGNRWAREGEISTRSHKGIGIRYYKIVDFCHFFSVEWWNVKAEGAMEFFLSHL